MDVALYVIAAAVLVVLILFAVKVRRQTRAGRTASLRSAAAVGRCLDADMPQSRLLNECVLLLSEEEPVEEDEAEQQSFQPTAKVGAKKQRKLEEKQAKKAQREAEMEEREERRRMQELREQERQQAEEKERLLEQKQEEQERRAKEEQEKREEEEYLRLKASFIVEEQGEEEQLSEDQSRNLLQEFIQYIETSKVVLLEDLASHFGMRTQDAISRLQDLLAEGSLTGVIDDRGKFISITPGELDSVAQFIRQRGRVSITELAQASNSLINLMPESRSAA
uniref:DDRGK domain-containing protein 1 n=1 Tax=Maylandia zebra TaxID=106582 RepID=A0A3P9CV24_9CICH